MSEALPDVSACAVVADEIRARGPKDGTEALALSLFDLIAERDRLQVENEAMRGALLQIATANMPYRSFMNMARHVARVALASGDPGGEDRPHGTQT